MRPFSPYTCTTRVTLVAIFFILPGLSTRQDALAQIPDTFQNLQVLPQDISRDSLVSIMRTFSFALGVRCQYCHVGGNGISFAGVEFDKDDDPDKRKARFMMRMVDNLNLHVLPLIPERDDPPVTIKCDTCHRGVARPLPLMDDMLLTTHTSGVDSAIVRYRELRDDYAMEGTYDFGEWEVNQVAETLVKEGRSQEAIKVYLLNEEFFPESTAIVFTLATLYEGEGELQAAIRYYERVLELAPEHQRAVAKLAELRDGNE